jgi:hypothetical protein
MAANLSDVPVKIKKRSLLEFYSDALLLDLIGFYYAKNYLIKSCDTPVT